MRILHISKYYYPYRGGVETVCQDLAESSKRKGDEVAVICFNDGKKSRTDDVNGITIYRVGALITIARQALSLSYYHKMKKVISDFKPDIIHFHWANPFPAALLLMIIPKDVKLVVHWHMDIIKQKTLYKLIKPIETRLLKRADRILVTSPLYMDYSIPLQQYKNKIDVVANAIRSENFDIRSGDEEKIKEIRQKYDNKDIVFFIGRHVMYKGLPYLLEAEKKVKSDCVFVIAGKGPLTEELMASCKADRVHFIGRISDDELRQYLYASKIFAFPSITKNEAFGIALAEAMYCGTPAVTFHIEGSGVNWVSQKDITCLEVPNKDTTAYANAIDRMLNDEDLYDRLSENGMKRVRENFLIDNMVKSCYDSYEKVMKI